MTNWEPPKRHEPQLPAGPRLPPPGSPPPVDAGSSTSAAAARGDDEVSPWKRRFLKIPVWGWAAGVVALIALVVVMPPSPEEDPKAPFLAQPTAPSVAGIEPTVSTPAQVETIDTRPTVSTPAQVETIESVVGTTATTQAQATSEVPPSSGPATGDPDAVARTLELLGSLTVADPDPARTPYERDTYDREGWGDFDNDCISTRHEVLITYSLDPAVMDLSGCFVEAGRWIDPYTGTEYTSAGEVTIDPVVPLAEAHRAGAWRWDFESRHRFANDEHPAHLRVVSGDVNQSKADKRPDEWLPPDPAAHCQYASDWTVTKARYRLTVTASERAALEAAIGTCDDSLLAVTDAPLPVVVNTTPATTATTTIAPSVGPGEVKLFACDARAEVVVIGNTGGEPISLSGYTLYDEGVNHSVSLGRFGTIEPGQQLALLSGPDANAAVGAFVWTGQDVWNNDGDTAFLIAPDGSEQRAGC